MSVHAQPYLALYLLKRMEILIVLKFLISRVRSMKVCTNRRTMGSYLQNLTSTISSVVLGDAATGNEGLAKYSVLSHPSSWP